MKKMISTLIILTIMLIPLSISADAADINKEIQIASNQEIEYFEDGSYAIITFTEELIMHAQTQTMAAAATQTKSGSKSYTYYNSDGSISWTVKLNGTFSYNGSSATCTASSVSYSINNSAWKITSAAASKSGATAIGNFTAKRYTLLIPVQTENVRLTITCSANGSLS